MNEDNARRARLQLGWVTVFRRGIPSRYVTSQLGQLSLASLRGRLIEYSFGWGKGGNVTAAGWQVTLCDPMWHASSRSGMATLRTAIDLLLTYLLAIGWHGGFFNETFQGSTWITTLTSYAVSVLKRCCVRLSVPGAARAAATKSRSGGRCA